jgi:hypothetical protein
MSLEKRPFTAFLNVDLDIRSQIGLEELLTSIASSVILLHQTENEASLELKQNFASVEETVVNFVEPIESLPTQARNVWNKCEFRKFNIGIQAGNEPHASSFALSSKTVSLLAGVQVGVIFTVYAPPNKK